MFKKQQGWGRAFYVNRDAGQSSVIDPYAAKPVGGPIALPGLWTPATPWRPNHILYEASTLIQRLLRGSPDGKNYSINGAYIEFANGGAPVDPVPTVDQSEGLSYFSTLSSPRDYLRVQITANYEASSDTDIYPDGDTTVFVVQSAGSVGHKNGLTFSDAVGSYVYGIALVAINSLSDSTQDRVLNRLYYEPDSQIPKVLGKEITFTLQQKWSIPEAE